MIGPAEFTPYHGAPKPYDTAKLYGEWKEVSSEAFTLGHVIQRHREIGSKMHMLNFWNVLRGGKVHVRFSSGREQEWACDKCMPVKVLIWNHENNPAPGTAGLV